MDRLGDPRHFHLLDEGGGAEHDRLHRDWGGLCRGSCLTVTPDQGHDEERDKREIPHHPCHLHLYFAGTIEEEAHETAHGLSVGSVGQPCLSFVFRYEIQLFDQPH